MAWNESRASRDIQFNIYTLKVTKKLKDVIYAQNWKAVEVGHSILDSENVTGRKFYNFLQEHSEIWHNILKSLKVAKKSVLKMHSSKRNNLLINYARPKILKRTRDIYLKRPLKINACIGSNFRLPN